MSVLVTGASGFVGAHVVDMLAEAGLGDVVAADVSSAPKGIADPPSVRRVALDVTDSDAVRAAFAEWRPAFVVHAAALTPSPDEEAADAARIMAVNAGGAANVTAAAMAAKSVQRLLLFSSSGVHNGLSVYPDPLREDGPLPQAPASLYAVTKLACEGLAHRAVAAGLSACAIRVASVYGGRERATDSRKAARLSLIHRLALAAAAGRPVRIEGADAGRDWVHGDDVGRAAARLLMAPELRHVVYNVGSGEAVGFRALVAMLVAAGLQVTDDPAAPAFGLAASDHRPALDVERLAADAGVWTRINLAEGIAMLVAQHRYALARDRAA